MPSISDDVRVLEASLAELNDVPADEPFDSIATGYQKRMTRKVARMRVEAAANPARLRRVLDTMQAMGEALRPFVGATLSEQGHVIGLMREDFAKAVAAMALYEGTK